MERPNPSDDTEPSDDSAAETDDHSDFSTEHASAEAAEDYLEPFEMAEVTLDAPYTLTKEIAGTDVELRVEAASIRASRVPRVMNLNCVTVENGTLPSAQVNGSEDPQPHNAGEAIVREDVFRDAATATEYAVYADDELVIDGGEPTHISRLENELCEQVGVARRAKRRLMESGWDADELDEFSAEAEEFLIDFYTNLHITGAENMVKGMAFRAADDDELIDRVDAAHPAEVRHWVQETRDQLSNAMLAVDQFESMAEDLLGNAYHKATLSDTPSTEQEQSDETDPETDGRDTDNEVPDIEEIRTAMFDSDLPSEAFAQREAELADGRTLEVQTGSYVSRVVAVDEDGNEEQIGSSDSLAEVVQIFEEYRVENE